MSVTAETIQPDIQTQHPVHAEAIPPRHRWTVAEYHKVPLYARHGIPEVWLLDLQKQVLEIYRNPEQGKYQHIEHLRSGQVTPLHLPEAVIQLADLFPGP